MSDSATDEEWEELLHQLRVQPPVQSRPFFYNRVQGQLAIEARQPWLPGWVRRPAYALVLGALVLVLSGDDPALASGVVAAAAHLPAPR